MSDPEPEVAELQIHVAEELVTGTFADVVSVWHTPFGFTMDFAVLDRPRQDDEGNTVVPANVVSRMKIPANVIFQIARAIADNVHTYENRYGPITPLPGDGPVIPSDSVDGQEDPGDADDDDD